MNISVFVLNFNELIFARFYGSQGIFHYKINARNLKIIVVIFVCHLWTVKISYVHLVPEHVCKAKHYYDKMIKAHKRISLKHVPGPQRHLGGLSITFMALEHVYV